MATWQQIKNKTDYVTVITTPSIEKLPVAQSGKKKKKKKKKDIWGHERKKMV